MGLKREVDPYGKRGDIWKFATNAIVVEEHFLLLESTNHSYVPYPGDRRRYNWRALNMTYGIYEDLVIDYDPCNWKKVG